MFNVKTETTMKKKVYISPVLQVFQLGNERSIMATSNLNLNPTGSGNGSDAGIKAAGDWDIWGSDDVDFDEE